MTDQSSKYLIHEATRDNKPLLVENLLAENSKLFSRKDEDERSALHWACSLSNDELVRVLLKYRPQGFDIDDMVDASGWTPVHIASSVGNVGILRQLLALDPKPDVDLATNQGTTALHLAISKSHLSVVECLVAEAGASCRIKDKRGLTPLHRASCTGSQPTIRLLCEPRHKINVNARDNDGWTSLHHALAEGHADVAVLLVSLGADPTIADNQGQTPEQVAVDDRVAKYFKQHI